MGGPPAAAVPWGGWWGYIVFDSRPARRSPEGGVTEAGAQRQIIGATSRKAHLQTIKDAGHVPTKEATAKAPAEAQVPPRGPQKPLSVCQ
eukprot:3739198-Pyramimonas_sp.AAC.1